ncbi:MAG: hypothetical protein A4E66_02521 [Syntrophus sp. PtaB.Bin001]|nr:MAG: hypothetical protein A4E66_02521 [Syntrophus sp. PtaB.Bin001]
MAAQKPYSECDGRQTQNDIEHNLAELGDLPEQGGLQFLGGGDEFGYPPHLRSVTNGHHDTYSLAVGNQGRTIGHVLPVRQDRIVGQGLVILLDGHGLSGERRFVDLQVAGRNQAHIGRDLVPGLQQDDVARHHLGRRNPLLLAGTEDRSLRDHGPGKGLHRLYGFGLLKETDCGIDEHDPEDHPGIHPFLKEKGDQGGGKENVHKGLVELEEKPKKRAFALLRRQDIETELLAPVLDLEDVQTKLPIAVQQIDDFFSREIVPVPPNYVVHGFTLLPVVEYAENRRIFSLKYCIS